MAESTQKGPRELLKGKKWFEFFEARNQELIIEGELFKMRVGFFFHIRACCIIHNKKFIVLRKISTKAWDTNTLETILVEAGKPFHWMLLSPPWEKEPTGNWWFLTAPNNAVGLYSSQPPQGFVLARSKFDILRGV
jgi:hypothetical protein